MSVLNRQGPADDFLAAAFPGMHLAGGRRLALPELADCGPGSEKEIPVSREILELVGTEAALARLLACDGMRRLAGMGAIEVGEIEAPFVEPGEQGVAFVRDRSTAKLGPAKLRRMQKRAEAFGRDFTPPRDPARADPALCAFHLGDTVLRVREIPGIVAEGPLTVSTYGLSRPGAPSILPVMPAIGAELADAA